jgi:hypothetical protein
MELRADMTWLGVSKNLRTQFWNCFFSSAESWSLEWFFFKVFSLQIESILDIRAMFASAATIGYNTLCKN